MDEPIETAEQTGGEQTTSQQTPTGEEKTTENAEAQGQTEATDHSEGQQDTAAQQGTQGEEHKPRAEKRLRQLLDKYGDGDKAGEQGSQDTTSSRSNLPTPPWWQPKVEPGQEVTPEQYKADLARTADEIATTRIKQYEQQQARIRQQEKQVQTFAKTASSIEAKYPALNPDSDKFNPDLSDRVTKLYEKASGKQPNADLLQQIAETVMEASEQAMVEGESTVTSKLVDRAAQAAITPTGGTERSDLSKEQMEEMKRTNPGKLADMLGKKLSWVD